MQAEHIDFEQATAGLRTKSEKIRELGRRGVPTAEIARFLDIRYQHARNVLKDAGLHKVAGTEPAAAPVRSFAWVDLHEDGSLTIPGGLLAAAGIAVGQVHVRRTDYGLEVLSPKAAVARAQAIARQFIPPGSPSMVDELIAERRQEVERENG